MTELLSILMVFSAAYFTVLLLGLQSKLMRDNIWMMSFFTSWGITVAQTASTYAIAHSVLGIWEYVFWSGWGGSLGIVSSHFVYQLYEKWRGR